MSTGHPSGSVSIGIDVGGTDIKGGLVTREGRVVHKTTIATEVEGGVDQVIGRIARCINQLRDRAAAGSATVAGAGLGMPGTLSRRRGVIIAPPNLTGWLNIPVVDRLQPLTGLRVLLDNDANLAALGEYLAGAGRGVRDMVMLTLGTGIGSGIIIDGKVFRGAGENAGEFGHSIVHFGGRRCGCGQLGCLEAHTSARHLSAIVAEEIQAGQPSALNEVLQKSGKVEPLDIVQAARAGDALATRIWINACRYLAVGCINIHAILDPERIVFAGGMSNAGDFLLKYVRQGIEEQASPMLGEVPELRIAELGNDAGFIGAAMSVFHEAPA